METMYNKADFIINVGLFGKYSKNYTIEDRSGCRNIFFIYFIVK